MERSLTAWPEPAGHQPEPEDADLWIVDLDEPGLNPQRLSALLSEPERQRACGLRSAQLRERFVAGRAALRIVLGRYCAASPHDLRFAGAVTEKPVLAVEQARGLAFNLAHSGPAMVIAIVAGAPVGVDLEQLRAVPDARRIAERLFAPSEQHALSAVTNQDYDRCFLDIWTRKEAYVKAIGTGFPSALPHFAVGLAAQGPCPVAELRGGEKRPAGWDVYPFNPGPGYVAALAAVAGVRRSLRLRHFGFAHGRGSPD